MKQHNGALIAIYDNVAKAIAGPISVHHNIQAAIRYYNDIVQNPQTIMHKHVEDFDLVQLGFFNEKWEVIAAHETIMTGRAWLASQPIPEPQLVKES